MATSVRSREAGPGFTWQLQNWAQAKQTAFFHLSHHLWLCAGGRVQLVDNTFLHRGREEWWRWRDARLLFPQVPRQQNGEWTELLSSPMCLCGSKYDSHIYSGESAFLASFAGLNDRCEAGSGLLSEPTLAQMGQCWIFCMLVNCPERRLWRLAVIG